MKKQEEEDDEDDESETAALLTAAALNLLIFIQQKANTYNVHILRQLFIFVNKIFSFNLDGNLTFF